jgi:hypothetical protein
MKAQAKLFDHVLGAIAADSAAQEQLLKLFSIVRPHEMPR